MSGHASSTTIVGEDARPGSGASTGARATGGGNSHAARSQIRLTYTEFCKHGISPFARDATELDLLELWVQVDANMSIKLKYA